MRWPPNGCGFLKKRWASVMFIQSPAAGSPVVGEFTEVKLVMMRVLTMTRLYLMALWLNNKNEYNKEFLCGLCRSLLVTLLVLLYKLKMPNTKCLQLPYGIREQPSHSRQADSA